MPDASPTDLTIYVTLIVALYKIASLAVGLLFGYMGYRLFLAGIDRPAGDLEAETNGRKLALKGAAPGTFLALFGAIVVGVTIWKGLDVDLPRPLSDAVDILPDSPPELSSDSASPNANNETT